MGELLMKKKYFKVERTDINRKYIEWSLNISDYDLEKRDAFNRVYRENSDSCAAFFTISEEDYKLIFCV